FAHMLAEGIGEAIGHDAGDVLLEPLDPALGIEAERLSAGAHLAASELRSAAHVRSAHAELRPAAHAKPAHPVSTLASREGLLDRFTDLLANRLGDLITNCGRHTLTDGVDEHIGVEAKSALLLACARAPKRGAAGRPGGLPAAPLQLWRDAFERLHGGLD